MAADSPAENSFANDADIIAECREAALQEFGKLPEPPVAETKSEETLEQKIVQDGSDKSKTDAHDTQDAVEKSGVKPTEEAAAAATQVEEVGVPETVAKLAVEYGLEPDEYSGVQSVDELNRLLSFKLRLSQRLLPKATPPSQVEAQPTSEAVKQESKRQDEPVKKEPETVAADTELATEKLIAKLEKEGYDAPLLDFLKADLAEKKRLAADNKAMAAKLQQMEASGEEARKAQQAQAEAQQRAATEAAQFKDTQTIFQTLEVLDGSKELLGTDGNRTPEQQERLTTLATAAYHTQYEACARKQAYVPITPALVKQAYTAAFQNIIRKQSQDARTKKVQEQGKQIMGKSEANRNVKAESIPHQGDPSDYEAIANRADIRAIFERSSA